MKHRISIQGMKCKEFYIFIAAALSIVVVAPSSFCEETISPKFETGYTSDLYKDGQSKRGVWFYSPSLQGSYDIVQPKPGSPFLLNTTLSFGGRFTPEESRAHEYQGSAAFQGNALLSENSELIHSLRYQFSDANVDSHDKLKSHEVGIAEALRIKSGRRTHRFEIPFSTKIFTDPTTGQVSDVYNIQEANFRDSNFLAGTHYSLNQGFRTRDSLSWDASVDYRYYFSRKARATDGGVIPDSNGTLNEVRISNSLGYVLDAGKFVLEPRGFGTMNLDVARKAEDFWETGSALNMTLRLTRFVKVSTGATYSFRAYLNKRSDVINVTGAKLTTHRIGLPSEIQIKVLKKIKIFTRITYERLLSTDHQAEYKAITSSGGLSYDFDL